MLKRIPKPLLIAIAVPVGAAALDWLAKRERTRKPDNKYSDQLTKASEILRKLK